MVWRRCQNISGASFSASSSGNGHVEGDPQLDNISDAVRIVINGLGGMFTANDIEQGLKDHGLTEGKKVKRLSITNTLHRLARRSEIEVVKKGQGRTPATYRKADTSES